MVGFVAVAASAVCIYAGITELKHKIIQIHCFSNLLQRHTKVMHASHLCAQKWEINTKYKKKRRTW